jgi:hypothetical protein
MSPPNNAHYLRAAQQRRRTDLIDKIRDAVRELDATGQPITVNAVVRVSGASRAFIYRLPDIVAQIQQLRDRQTTTGQRQPTRQRASDASNHARIRQLTTTNAELRAELRQLREQNALLLGRLRENRPPPVSEVDP